LPDAQNVQVVRQPISDGREGDSQRIIKNPRVEVIDVFRFVAAFWVMLDHAGQFPFVNGFSKTDAIGLAVRGVFNNLFCGPAAVIVFFVISGYCIHRPYRHIQRLPLRHYFIRRFVRILFPMAAAILVATPVGVSLRLFHDTILWSLLAELIYYSIYPLLRIAARRMGWKPLIVIAYAGWTVLLVLYPRAPSYASYGIYGNWIMGLPCWLLGCLLAERDPVEDRRSVGRFEIWSWRAGIWSMATACSALHFHSPVRYSWTLNVFAIPVFFWLCKEISFHVDRRASPILAWAGLWTYSLYLTHEITLAAYQSLPTSHFSSRLNWCLATTSMLVAAYMFYLLVEKPGHLLARYLARFVDPRLVVKQNRI
jgi:peptidoglycan/LPS O-acetylase OafA/YrhL